MTPEQRPSVYGAGAPSYDDGIRLLPWRVDTKRFWRVLPVARTYHGSVYRRTFLGVTRNHAMNRAQRWVDGRAS